MWCASVACRGVVLGMARGLFALARLPLRLLERREAPDFSEWDGPKIPGITTDYDVNLELALLLPNGRVRRSWSKLTGNR